MLLSSLQQVKLTDIARIFGIRFIILYGSEAKRRARVDSDVDIAILGRSPLSQQDMRHIESVLIDIFSTRELDIRSLRDATPFFRYQVFAYGVLLAGDRHDFALAKLAALRAYRDDRQVRQMRDALIVRRQRHLESLGLVHK